MFVCVCVCVHVCLCVHEHVCTVWTPLGPKKRVLILFSAVSYKRGSTVHVCLCHLYLYMCAPVPTCLYY